MKKVLPILMLLALFGLSKAFAQTYYVNQNFSGGVLPVGWTTTAAGTGGQWVFGTGFTNSYLPLSQRPDYALINDAGCSCIEDSARLATLTVNCASPTVFLAFDYLYANYTNGTQVENFKVEYST